MHLITGTEPLSASMLLNASMNSAGVQGRENSTQGERWLGVGLRSINGMTSAGRNRYYPEAWVLSHSGEKAHFSSLLAVAEGGPAR